MTIEEAEARVLELQHDWGLSPYNREAIRLLLQERQELRRLIDYQQHACLQRADSTP